MKKKMISIGRMLLIEIAAILILFFTITRMSYMSVSFFIDAPSLIGLLLMTVPLLFASGMHKDFIRAFSIGKKEYSLLQMKKSLEAVNMVKNLILCSIGFVVIIDFIILLHKMTAVSQLGPNVAVMALTILYGIILEFLLIPLSTVVQNHILDAMNIDDDDIYTLTDEEENVHDGEETVPEEETVLTDEVTAFNEEEPIPDEENDQ